ncbi:unnamed protein product [Allacma fusca]|uniref:ascorbate ferrireductase (transmembrane) n=1 Tax=Allacma fusca TaxID=39272 RepID=A0A8J2LK65_9HEXA|nr:unnamed protein product [Allacma fusca]
MSLLTWGFNLAHVFVTASGVTIFYLARPGSSLFSYHPALMAVGTMVLSFESVLLLKDKRVPRRNKIFVHWATGVSGLVVTLLAFQAIYRFKSYNSRAHFATLHGRFGIATIAVLLLQNLGGLPTKYGRSVMNWTGIHKKKIREWHEVGSLISGVCMTGTIISAFFSKWFVEVTGGGAVWWTLLGMTMLPRFFFGYVMQTSKAQKLKNKEKNKKSESVELSEQKKTK